MGIRDTAVWLLGIFVVVLLGAIAKSVSAHDWKEVTEYLLIGAIILGFNVLILVPWQYLRDDIRWFYHNHLWRPVASAWMLARKLLRF